jgi:murein DD-endopeptidase MepM/ murein hydrolase activator NlpD
MALASSIALVEYATYSPSTFPDSLNDFSFSQDDDSYESPDLDLDGVAIDSLTAGDPSILPEEKEQSDIVEKQPQPENFDRFRESDTEEIAVKSGDTLESILRGLGFDKTDIYLLSKSLSKVFNLRNMKVGQKITVRGRHDESGDLLLNGLELRQSYNYRVIVSRTDSGFKTERVEIPIKNVIRSISGIISPRCPDYSLKQCGVDTKVSAEALRVLSQFINIKTSKTPIDFEFLCKEFYDDSGTVVRSPVLLYISAFINGKIKRIYNFSDDGSNEYIDSDGTVLKTLVSSSSMLSPPLRIMKVTSRFGMRVHPITGRASMHRGVDLSAKIGTFVKAPASGIVQQVSTASGYGRYVMITHGNSVTTLYGHLSKALVRVGEQVFKGKLIALTGDSGRVRGAHLHYEVRKNGRSINPLLFIKQSPKKLSGRKLARFNQFKREINLQIVGLDPTSKNKVAKTRKYI